MDQVVPVVVVLEGQAPKVEQMVLLLVAKVVTVLLLQ